MTNILLFIDLAKFQEPKKWALSQIRNFINLYHKEIAYTIGFYNYEIFQLKIEEDSVKRTLI